MVAARKSRQGSVLPLSKWRTKPSKGHPISYRDGQMAFFGLTEAPRGPWTPQKCASRFRSHRTIYACMDWHHIGEMLAASDTANFELLNLCVWVTTNGDLGSLYRSRHELVFVLRNGRLMVRAILLSQWRARVRAVPGICRQGH
jgi:hypothetical protein